MVTTVLAGVIVVAPGSPAGAAPQPVTLTMPEGGGALTLRDADEAKLLDQPTTVTATQDDETGEITDGVFSTPDVEVVQYLEDFKVTAYVDAHFAQVGDVTGSVDHTGKVTVRIKVDVELHIEIERPPALTGDCVAPGVNLLLESTSPYDPGTGTVSLLDANFTIPQFVQAGSCGGAVRDGLNDLIAGPGHRLALNFDTTGLIKPLPPGESTTTSLAVTPTGGANQGDDVTLTATVANTTTPANTPTGGTVRFTDGSTIVGETGLVNGVATLITDDLQAGTRSLRAAYLGVGGSFAKSTSTRVTYAVGAPSLVTATGPKGIGIGAGPAEYTAVVRNPGPGTARTQRADLTIRRFGVANALLNDSHLDVEVKQPDNTWAPMALTDLDPNDVDLRYGVIGSLDPDGGVALAAGVSRTITFRVSTAAGTYPGEVRFSIKLVAPNSPFEPPKQADPGPPVVPAESPTNNPSMWSRHIDLLPETRATTTIEPGIFGFSWGTPQARAGAQAHVSALIIDATQEAPYRGTVNAFLDGEPVDILMATRLHNDPFAENTTIDQGSGEMNLRVAIPKDTAPGEHTMRISYSGDEFRLPVTSPPIPLSIAPALGETYECVTPNGFENTRLRVSVDASATVPSVVEAGGTGTAADLAVRMRYNRDNGGAGLLELPFGRDGVVHELDGVPETVSSVTSAEVTFTDGSTSSFTAGTLNPWLDPNAFGSPEPENPDIPVALWGGTHTFGVPDTPGETVPVGIETIRMEMFVHGIVDLTLRMACTPVDEVYELGEVTVGGVDLSVEPGLVSAGDSVGVTVTVTPETSNGNVVFLADGVPASFAPVHNGVASTSLSSLSVGVHEIVAELIPSFDTPAMVSDPVSVTVVPEATSPSASFVIAALLDYTGSVSQADVDAGVAALEGGQSKAAFLRELSLSDEYLAHVVNEMYLDTLGRVGDSSGVAFWVGRLRSGYSVARVAASFYGSDEYYGRKGGTDEAWVNDLYDVLLGRPADAAGRAYWVGQIPVRGRGGVALAFFQTPESARSRVATLYGAFLGRSANQADQGFWAGRVIAQGDLVLAVHLTVSDEYQTRAETRFPPA